MSEDAPLLPISAYGMSRAAAEGWATMHARVYGLELSILRCGNVYGDGQPVDRGQGAVAVFLDRIDAGEPITLFGGGSAVRDWVHIDDVTAAVESALVVRNPGAVNVGSGVGLSVLDVLGLVADAVGRAPAILHRPLRDLDVPAVVLDVTRLRAVLGIEPRAFEDALPALVDARRSSVAWVG